MRDANREVLEDVRKRFDVRHVGSRLAGNRQFDDRAVAPEALKGVEDAIFVVLDVDDDIRVVKQDPAARATAFVVYRADVEELVELVFDLVNDRVDLALGSCRGDQEGIGDAEALADVQCDEVFCLLFCSGDG